MNALSLSKSTPRNSQGNKLWARLIASTTRLPSRLTSGRHSVHNVHHRQSLDEDLARILEHHLISILAIGEAMLKTYRKHPRKKKELGGRRFE
jgi:hypothetical protein